MKGQQCHQTTGILDVHSWEEKNRSMKSKFTWTMRTSPKVLKYSFRSCSVVFHGRPNTIKSDVFWTALFTFTADEASVSSIFLLLSKQNEQKPFRTPHLTCLKTHQLLHLTTISKKILRIRYWKLFAEWGQLSQTDGGSREGAEGLCWCEGKNSHLWFRVIWRLWWFVLPTQKAQRNKNNPTSLWL